jgi:hypothetical protein
MRTCVTEFGAQGLELDAVLLAWGTDLMLTNGRWSNARASGYQDRRRVRNPFQLRLNAYRVLLTRGRDATVAFVPALAELNEGDVPSPVEIQRRLGDAVSHVMGTSVMTR